MSTLVSTYSFCLQDNFCAFSFSKQLKTFTNPNMWNQIIHFFIIRLVTLLLQFLSTALRNNTRSLVLQLFLLQYFFSLGNIFSSFEKLCKCSEIIPVESFHINGKQEMARKLSTALPLVRSLVLP